MWNKMVRARPRVLSFAANAADGKPCKENLFPHQIILYLLELLS